MDERRRHWRGPRHPATCTCVECNRARNERLNPTRRQAEGDRRRQEILDRTHERDRLKAQEFAAERDAAAHLSASQDEAVQRARYEQFQADPNRNWKRTAGPVATVATIIALAAFVAVVVTVGALLT